LLIYEQKKRSAERKTRDILSSTAPATEKINCSNKTKDRLNSLLQQQKRSADPTNRTRPKTDSTRFLKLLYWKRSTKDRLNSARLSSTAPATEKINCSNKSNKTKY
jgi:hypothetical protein